MPSRGQSLTLSNTRRRGRERNHRPPHGWSTVIPPTVDSVNYEIVSKTRLSAGENPPLPRTRTDCPRKFRMEREDQHHDDGLAHDAGLFTRVLRLLHLVRQP